MPTKMGESMCTNNLEQLAAHCLPVVSCQVIKRCLYYLLRLHRAGVQAYQGMQTERGSSLE